MAELPMAIRELHLSVPIEDLEASADDNNPSNTLLNYPALRQNAAARRRAATPAVIALLAALGALCLFGRKLGLLGGEQTTGMSSSHRAAERGDMQEKQLVKTDADEVCSETEEDMDYVVEGDFSLVLQNILTPDGCCHLCQTQARCQVWTWVGKREGHLTRDECFLKGGTSMYKIRKEGLVSGRNQHTSIVRHSTTVSSTTEAPATTTLALLSSNLSTSPSLTQNSTETTTGAPTSTNSTTSAPSVNVTASKELATSSTAVANKSEASSNAAGDRTAASVDAKPEAAVSTSGTLSAVNTTNVSSSPEKTIATEASTESTPKQRTTLTTTESSEATAATEVLPPKKKTTTEATTEPTTTEATTETTTTEATTETTTTQATTETTTTEATTTLTTTPTTVTTTTRTTTVSTTTITTTTEPSCPKPDATTGCSKTKCCSEPGLQCFAKNEFWAECMETCEPGLNLFDQSGPDNWECKALGERTPGEPKKCSDHGENCMDSQCCSGLGMQCFAKNSTFGRCKPSCEVGVDMGDDDWKPWTCEAKGARAPATADWVSEKCSKDYDNCATTGCCASVGMQCVLQNQWYGQCKAQCDTKDCLTKGPRTPALASTIGKSKSTIGKWVPERCSKMWLNCHDSQCCQEVGAQCFAKNSTFATCRTECSTAPDPKDGNSTWTCEALGPKSWGLAVKGWPSLYCFSLYMPSRYERPLMQAQLNQSAGIFACDGYDVYAAEDDTLGTTADGITVRSTLIPKIQVGVSQDGTAGNAKLFMAVWDKLIAGGRFRYYDWTIKVDPDAVLLPWRLRAHMESHNGENVYVVNCNKVPGSPNFPMMFGALEVFSKTAMEAYSQGSWKCGTQLPWKSWGEDYYMTHCMDFLGVGRIADFGVLGDNVCVGANCADAGTASFHPFKTLDAWQTCWDTANAAAPA